MKSTLIVSIVSLFLFGLTQEVMAQRMTGPCLFAPKQQVCAMKGKSKMTYANANCASLDGAKPVSMGPCKKPMAKGKKKMRR